MVITIYEQVSDDLADHWDGDLLVDRNVNLITVKSFIQIIDENSSY